MNPPREVLSQTKQAPNEYSRIAEIYSDFQGILNENSTHNPLSTRRSQ